MNEITFPILITIAVLGAIAIILVKLYYKDEDSSDLEDELPPIVANHWQESFELNPADDNDNENNISDIPDNNNEDESSEEYGFVSKSWEEPMEQKEEPDNGVATKVFQEPMHSKHQDIIANDYNDSDDPNNSGFDDLHNEGKLHDDFKNENLSPNSEEPVSEYITPKKYHYANNEDYDENGDYNPNNEGYNNYDEKENIANDYDLVNNYPDYPDKTEHTDSQTTFGALNMTNQVTIGGNRYNIKVGDEIIFNYSGESYSSKILEIKHENIKVKYRGNEKWISFLDVRKVF